jgi:hypothetical protein
MKKPKKQIGQVDNSIMTALTAVNLLIGAVVGGCVVNGLNFEVWNDVNDICVSDAPICEETLSVAFGLIGATSVILVVAIGVLVMLTPVIYSIEHGLVKAVQRLGQLIVSRVAKK